MGPKTKLTSTAIVLGCLTIQNTSALCPTPCKCSTIPGSRQTMHVNCRNKNLLEIPLDLDPETEILDLGQNNITTLDKTRLGGLSKLRDLYMDYNLLLKGIFVGVHTQIKLF